jgi:hypothetical protein
VITFDHVREAGRGNQCSAASRLTNIKRLESLGIVPVSMFPACAALAVRKLSRLARLFTPNGEKAVLIGNEHKPPFILWRTDHGRILNSVVTEDQAMTDREASIVRSDHVFVVRYTFLGFITRNREFRFQLEPDGEGHVTWVPAAMSEPSIEPGNGVELTVEFQPNP